MKLRYVEAITSYTEGLRACGSLLYELLERARFNNSEPVAIVRLSDLEQLLRQHSEMRAMIQDGPALCVLPEEIIGSVA